MARWGLCLGCVFGVLAIVAAGAAMRWSDGAAGWIAWGAFALFGWGGAMSVYSFDRPAPTSRAVEGGYCGRSRTPSGANMNPSLSEPTPEDVQEQMRETRAHMTGQIHALEDKVVGMAHDATEAVGGTVRDVQNAVHTATDWVRDSSESALASVRRGLDVRRQVRRYPWLAVGGAVALGFVCGSTSSSTCR